MASLLAAVILCAAVIALVVLAAPRARSGCPDGQHTAVTGHAKVTIGARRATIPVYGCEAP